MAFAVEAIPDDANLFRRIHRDHLAPQGTISSQAFNHERLSVNWEKYSDAQGTAIESSVAVVALPAGGCRALGQTVEHTPIEPDQPFGPNRAHAQICGKKDKTIRHRLRDMANVVWRRCSEA
ncbi:MAG: hypothetical protein ABSF95_14010 [Verrucomicrobiota bacterium]|jgi:hypothetical protein